MEIIKNCQSFFNELEAMGLMLKGYFDETTEQNNETEKIKEMALFESIKEEMKPMANIRLRKDGRYEGRISYNHKCLSIYSRKLSELKQKIRAKYKELKQQQEQLKITNKSITVKEYYKYWFETYKEPFLDIRSSADIKSKFNMYILPKFGVWQLQELTTQELQIFLNKIPKSRKKELIIIYFNAMLKKAFSEEYINRNPFDNVIKDKKIKSTKECFTLEEQKCIINEMTDIELKNIILIYLLTGLRKNEINNIIEITQKSIKVVCEKSDGRIKKIPLKPEVIDLIKENTKQKINTDKMYRRFKNFLDAHNIVNKSLHTTRHTYITNNFYLGNDMKRVSVWAGHSKVELTYNIYTNLNDSLEDRNEIKKLYNDLYYTINY